MGKQLSFDEEDHSSNKKKRTRPRPATNQPKLVEGKGSRTKRLAEKVRSQMFHRM
jgi:hypothetical protein